MSKGGSSSWSPGRGPLVIACAVLLGLALLLYSRVPNVRGVGSFVDMMAPWLGLGVLVLAVAALLRRAPSALVAVGIVAVIWAAEFGGALLPRGGGTPKFSVVSQNLLATNPDPAATVADLVATQPDLVALQEVSPEQRDAVFGALEGYPHRQFTTTVGLWSRYEITDMRQVDTGMGWLRAFRAEVSLPVGPTAVYVVHLASLRPGETGNRDHTISTLAEHISEDPADRLILLGDLNTATNDREMATLDGLLADAQRDAGSGFGFTWPSGFPLVRLDHVRYRGLDAVDASTIRTTGSDHRAVAAAFA